MEVILRVLKGLVEEGLVKLLIFNLCLPGANLLLFGKWFIVNKFCPEFKEPDTIVSSNYI